NRLGQFREAEALLRQVLVTYDAQLGRAHWQSGNARVYLGTVLTNLGSHAEARTALDEALQVLTAALGEDHYRTQNAREALAALAAARMRANRGRRLAGVAVCNQSGGQDETGDEDDPGRPGLAAR